LLLSDTISKVQRREQSRFTYLSRCAFSFPVTLATLLVMLTVMTARHKLNDPDLWWHLRVGEIIWKTRTVPVADIFSFTAFNHPWTVHEWLSEVTIYGSWVLGGYAGLMAWLCLFPALLLIASYALCWLHSGNAKVAFIGAIITWWFATVGLSVRPQLQGYLLLTCELLVLHLACSRNKRWFWFLPPLFAIWVNVHGSYFVGLIVLTTVLFCSYISIDVGALVSTRWDKELRNGFLIAFAGSIVALFVNPIGIDLVTYPLNAVLNPSPNFMWVSEWQPLTFDGIRARGLLACMGIIFGFLLFRRGKLTLQELLLVGLGLALSLRHTRMLFVFGILAAPVVSRILSSMWDGYDFARDRRLPNLLMVGFTAFAIVQNFPSTHILREHIKQSNPEEALAFIRSAKLTGPMLNDYNYGGYLIWAAPEHRVFVDGRFDMFEAAGVQTEYVKWASLSTDPTILLDKYRIQFCLLPRGAAMTQVIPHLRGWQQVYRDDVAVVFARTNLTGKT
jgi:hypothetical protein